jgi:hypothetical protein
MFACNRGKEAKGKKEGGRGRKGMLFSLKEVEFDCLGNGRERRLFCGPYNT